MYLSATKSNSIMVAKRVDSAQSMHLTNNGMRTKMMLGAFSALFLMVGNVCGQVATKFVKIDDVIKYSFYPQRVWGLNPMHDGKLYSSFTQTGDIAVSSYQTGAVVKTIPLGKVEDVSDYAFDASDSKLLISTKVNQIYRHSFTAQYVVLDVASGEAKALSDSGAQQQATFSPDGTKVAFTRDNNLFVKDLSSGVETQITTDGVRNKIINGTPDWVYEEEFGFSQAYAWSNDSKELAYYRFDESGVKEFEMQVYDGLYPSVARFKYPKAGEANSVVSIYCYNLETAHKQLMDVGTETDMYIPRIKWARGSGNLVIARLNRLQNKLELLMASSSTGSSQVFYNETNTRFLDYENLDNLYFLEDGKTFTLTSEKDGFRHLYLFDFNGKTVDQLTHGKFDVTKFYGFNEDRKEFYYQAAAVSPTQREVYAVGFKGKKLRKLSVKSGTNNADFSSDFSFFIGRNSDANTPDLSAVFANSGELVRVLQDNAALRAKMIEYNWQKKEFFSVKTPENITLNGWMIKPYNFDPTKRYPVLMYQYSGPDSQTALDEFGGFTEWFQLLAQKGYIIVSVDGRGTGARGEEFRKCTYKQLGKLESDDQVSVARYLRDQPFVEATRIGIFGWSYGGYMSLLSVLKGGEYLSAAVAVAPVTNWRFYDNIYTERYMRTPQENPDGYDSNSPINQVNKLQSNLLVIHGTGDDNVHVQNSIALSSELINAGKQFDMMLYPNENHGIRSTKHVMRHLYERMTDFILTKL
ncbi:MAG: hypothetical protein RIS47_1435 [Bacteroidota bacterium]